LQIAEAELRGAVTIVFGSICPSEQAPELHFESILSDGFFAANAPSSQSMTEEDVFSIEPNYSVVMPPIASCA
jgi:hypothetical protein